MKLYLSSFRLGNHPEKLVELFTAKPHVAVILNAKDHFPELERKESLEQQVKSLKSISVESSEIDLRDFKDPQELKAALQKYIGVWIVGGNSFLLRRAMYDSGFDSIIKELLVDSEFVYAGYSAGIVVAGETMHGLELVDDTDAVRAIYNSEVIWDGLHLVSYSIAPHYQSDHHESVAVESVVDYFNENSISFKPLRDGQVIIVDGEKEEIVG